MISRTIRENIYALGAQHWDRRLFDALIPLPDGTSYNAYLIHGSEKTALLDTVDPSQVDTLLEQLREVEHIDYIVSHHAEQDHAGAIPHVLEKYPQAKVIASPKGKTLLIDHLCIDDERFITVEDDERITLGNRTLQFVHTPWVHWPETICTYVPEERMLFTCDFFGSHIASTDLYVTDRARVYEAAKRYYAEIMMPFRGTIERNIEKLSKFAIDIIAPSHGSIYGDPAFIMGAYKDWIAEKPKNLAVIPYTSMHGSTKTMVEHLTSALAKRGVGVRQFELSVTDLGKLAISLVDAATIIIGTPTVHVAPHPAIFYASYLANALRPKLKYASIIGSYGWSSKAVERIAGLIPNLKVELFEPVLCKGYPRENTFEKLDTLAEGVAEKHRFGGYADIMGVC
ncbi:MAG: MBL fold metallo-hydrolase [Chitinivibrionales bacterium]|nr:MBL fold metallo-hydrolase [Chitinivibrionales bacterium]MBD3357777.1 MBL fold metallo-hydrolase [Chitinivibrionales bacterium]